MFRQRFLENDFSKKSIFLEVGLFFIVERRLFCTLSLREAIATWQSPVQSDQIATASMKPRNDNKSAARNDRGGRLLFRMK